MTAEQKEILSILLFRCEAMIDKNIALLSNQMADDLILYHVTGDTQTKNEWIECIKSEEMKYFRIDIVNPVIRIIDNQASITYTSIIDARIFGYRNKWTINGESFLEKINGNWIWSNFPDNIN
jgi:hypothetical protein